MHLTIQQECELVFHVTLHSPKKLLPFFHFEFVSCHAFDQSTGASSDELFGRGSSVI
jgi:hypothetical protein